MIHRMHQKRLQRILAGLWRFRTVYQIVIALFLVVGRSWSLWIAGWTRRWNVVEWPCGWLAKSWNFTSFYKSAQNASESFLAVIRQEIRAVRAGMIVARSRRIMQLNARCFFLTYTTIQKIGNWVSALCTNFALVYCVLFTICSQIHYIGSKKRLICVKNRTSAAVIFLIKNHHHTG